MVQRLPPVIFCLLLCSFFLSCSPTTLSPVQPSLYLYRFNPPAFVELSIDLQPVNEIPFSIPLNCSLFDVFPAPIGKFLSVELSCPNGQTVLFLDTETGSITQPVQETDSHFLAWANDGESAYLKVDSFGSTRVVRAYTIGKEMDLNINGWTYDLSAKTNSDDFIFSYSRGIGYGSELYSAQDSGRNSKLLYKDQFNYISFARTSPDDSRIAFIKIPDSQTPFTVGALWVIDVDGANARELTEVDAGHGYAANWSPDGRWIAFVKRENADDENADRSSDSLISNIYLLNVQSGELKPVTSFTSGYAETPHWSPDGNTLVFNTVLNGRMEVQIADIATGESHALIAEPACCPAWMRK